MDVFIVQGSAKSMGEQHGEHFRMQIQELSTLRNERLLYRTNVSFDDMNGLAQRCLKIYEVYDREGFEEFCGIAKGSSMTNEALFLMQAHTDLIDVTKPIHALGAECSSMIIPASYTQDGCNILAQNWDLYTNEDAYLQVIHRKPLNNAIETVSLTVTGGLNMVGMNAAGIAVGTTNIRTYTPQSGVHYLGVLHKILRQRTISEVTQCITDAPRAGAHYYFYGDDQNNLDALECTIQTCQHIIHDAKPTIYCNHALSKDIKSDCFNTPPMQEWSEYRKNRIESLLASSFVWNIENVKNILADHEGGDLAICRHDINGVSTNASIIMLPEKREMHVCIGKPHEGLWHIMQL